MVKSNVFNLLNIIQTSVTVWPACPLPLSLYGQQWQPWPRDQAGEQAYIKLKGHTLCMIMVHESEKMMPLWT